MSTKCCIHRVPFDALYLSCWLFGLVLHDCVSPISNYCALIADRVFFSRDSFPQEHVESLRDLIVELTGHSIVVGKNKVILRKLFVTVRYIPSVSLTIVQNHQNPALFPGSETCTRAF